MRKRVSLYADEGKVLTNGTDFVESVTLAVGKTGDEWHEITKEEYNALLESKTDE